MRGLAVAAFVATALLSAPAAAATSVHAALATPTSLGSFAVGTYRITATGLVDLVGVPGSGFTMRPNGMPDSPVTTPGYGYFNPNGSVIADGNYGVAGSAFKIGSLVGTFVANPGVSDFFGIGFATTVTLLAPGSIYAMVNDTGHFNNGGAFSVEVSMVPEPENWAMLIVGFGLTGAVLRRRRAMAS
jgi:hypothetical protein